MQSFIQALRASARRVGPVACALFFWCFAAAMPARGQNLAPLATPALVGTWGAGQAGPPLDANTDVFSNQTVRLIVHSSAGGSSARIRVSNEMGSTPLSISAAHLALGTGSGASIVAGSDRTLTFNGATRIVVPAGAAAVSDLVTLVVPPLSDLSVSLYFSSTVRASTVHAFAAQDGFVSTPGNYVRSSSFPVQRYLWSWPFLAEVDLGGTTSGAAIVALGDSITDGLRSNGNANQRWPDWLARRLQASTSASNRLAVINRGIAGNRLLSNPQVGSLAGRSALERLDRDVLIAAGARYVVVLIGINDLINSSSSSPVTANDLIAGYSQIITRAHAKGIAVIGGTMTPFLNADYYTAQKDIVRQAANNWIRSGGQFDGIVDFDALLRDPANPRRLNPVYDSGDHLHPNSLGYQLMGNAVPLSLFSAPGVRVLSVGADADEGVLAH